MSFLNSILLAGLALATLPIIIHLLGKKRIKKQPFPALVFLQRLQTKKMRNLKIRQWLILLFRTLGILFLAFAFLRPVIGSLLDSGIENSDTIILIDLSASMSARRPDGNAVDHAREVIESLYITNPGSRFAVVTSSGNSSRDINWHISNGKKPGWIKHISADGRNSDWGSAFTRCQNLLNEGNSQASEIIWLSDFSDTKFDSIPKFDKSVNIRRVNLSKISNPLNVYIKSVRVLDPLLHPEHPVQIEVISGVVGAETPIKALLSLKISGRRLAEGEIELSGNDNTVHRFSVIPGNSGILACEAEIDFDDAMLLDNRYPFTLNIPVRQKVLLTGDDKESVKLLELALNPSGQSLFDLTVLYNGFWQNLNFFDYDVLIIAGKKSFRDSDAQRVSDFIRRGGAAWIFLDDQIDPKNYSQTIFTHLNMSPFVGDQYAMEVNSSWEFYDSNHPALKGIIEPGGKFDKPVVKRIFPLKQGKDDFVLIRNSDSSPFILEHKLENGFVWLTPVSCSPDWSDWALSGIFAPMIQSSVSYLSTFNSQPLISVCGEDVILHLSDETHDEPVAVIDPLGNELIALRDMYSGNNSWIFSETIWPGNYQVLQTEAENKIFSVVFPPEESKIEVRDNAQLNLPGKLIEAETYTGIGEALRSLRTGKEISIWFLIPALIFLLAETILIREKKQS